MTRRTMWIRLMFLALALTCASGFRFRCYWLCTDQTGVQNDYVEERDQCRQYAQLKYDAMAQDEGTAAAGQSRSATLVKLFSECMGEHGWTVPSGESAAAPQVTAIAPTTPFGQQTTKSYSQSQVTTATMMSPPAATDEKASLARKAECDFARESASVSHIAADRAEACDLECAQALKANPGGPLPAACPSDYPRPAAPATTATHTATMVTQAVPQPAPVPVKKSIHHKKAAVATAPAQPLTTPTPAPLPVLPPVPAAVTPPSPVPPSPIIAPPVPVSIEPQPAETSSTTSLLSGLLGADITLLVILLALYLAVRHGRRHTSSPVRRRAPSLSAKIRGRSDD